jgi:hypothetical protein
MRDDSATFCAARSCASCQRWARRNRHDGKCGLYEFVVTPPGEGREFGVTLATDRCGEYVAEPDLFAPATFPVDGAGAGR